jgi:hypothetical protein
LVRVAYGDDGPLTQDRLAVSETWPERRAMMSEKYDIQATAERELAQRDLPGALRQLLSDRFKLTVHRETRAVPSYRLVLARPGGRLGPGLRRSSIECAQPGAAAENGRSPCGFQSFPGKASGRVPIGDLARRVLPAGVGDGRPIEDNTACRVPSNSLSSGRPMPRHRHDRRMRRRHRPSTPTAPRSSPRCASSLD